ncbi:MAG: hypothetical protein NVSMB42_22340 [Herpetosiphon sp.]
MFRLANLIGQANSAASVAVVARSGADLTVVPRLLQSRESAKNSALVHKHLASSSLHIQA